jgi:hypothetical protein
MGLLALGLFLVVLLVRRFTWGLSALRYVGPILAIGGPLYYHPTFYGGYVGPASEWLMYFEVAAVAAVLLWCGSRLNGYYLVIATVLINCLHMVFWAWVMMGLDYALVEWFLREWGMLQLATLLSWALWMDRDVQVLEHR